MRSNTILKCNAIYFCTCTVDNSTDTFDLKLKREFIPRFSPGTKKDSIRPSKSRAVFAIVPRAPSAAIPLTNDAIKGALTYNFP